jgi:hypothetical protein
MLAHLRSESYSLYHRTFYPPATLRDQEDVNVTCLEQQIDQAKRRVGHLMPDEPATSHGIQRLLDLSKREVS